MPADACLHNKDIWIFEERIYKYLSQTIKGSNNTTAQSWKYSIPYLSIHKINLKNKYGARHPGGQSEMKRDREHE